MTTTTHVCVSEWEMPVWLPQVLHVSWMLHISQTSRRRLAQPCCFCCCDQSDQTAGELGRARERVTRRETRRVLGWVGKGLRWVTYAAAGTSIIYQRRIHLRQIAGHGRLRFECGLQHLWINCTYDDTSWVLPPPAAAALLSVQQPRRHVSPLGRPRRVFELPMPNGSNNRWH